jgi:hypothetical protein
MSYYTKILELNFELQDAMSEHTGANRDKLALAVRDLDLLAHGDATQNCWDARPAVGSAADLFLVYWGSQYTSGTSCGELDTLTAQLLRQIADNIAGFEPGLAEVARSLADQADTAGEQLGIIEPDIGDVWEQSPDWIKYGALGIAALLLIRAIR